MSQSIRKEGKPLSRFFVLAHPDDEIMALPLLLQKHFNNYVVYLTDGGGIHGKPSKNTARSQELSRALHLLQNEGICIIQVPFLFSIPDGSCHQHLSARHIMDLESSFSALGPAEIVSMSYEGGHQDHDSANVVARILARRKSKPITLFATYRANSSRIFPFRAMSPVHPGPEIKFSRMTVIWIALRLMLIYRSQWKTWAGLGPPVLARFLFGTWNMETAVQGNEIPSIGDCFYENRGRAQQSEVIASLRKFRSGIQPPS